MAGRRGRLYTGGMRTRTKLLLGAGALAVVAAALARRRHWPGFRGRVVLVTGGSRGLGLALAREFARRGARLALCARDAEELERARADVARLGAEVFAVACDISDPRQAEDLVRRVEG